MRHFRKTILFLVIMMIASMYVALPAMATSATRSEAVAWAQARANESWCVDVDGSYGCQCVDLILAYYNYLVGWHTSGNAKDYAGNTLPGGWTRNGTPAAGAVVVWGAGARLSQYEYADSTYGHIGIVLSVDGSNLTTVETNAGGSANAKVFSRYSSGVLCYIHPDFQPEGAYLDVNGFLDGANNGGLGGYGTCDVYINGSLVANDVGDYCTKWPQGTTYRIADIKANSGYKYEGVKTGSLSGTVGTSDIDVRLTFTSYATLDVKGLLDNVSSGSISGFGKFDVYINGTLDAIGVNDYYKQWPQGTTYEIKNIQTEEGKYYNGVTAGSLSGTLGKGTTTVTMSMSTIVQAGPDWREEASLPGYIDPSTIEIQYNNHYEKTATSSPGTGWTQVAGSGVTTYVNSGSVYDSDFELATSNTRLLVGTYYYHYCGYNNWVEHYQTGAYTTYHTCGTANIAEIATYTDDADARYTVYRLQWTGGTWAGGAALCASENSDLWYKRYQYQDRTAVTNYKWTKDSGWVSTKDSAATSTKVRFRLKQYNVTFDANGGVNAPEKQVKYHGIDLELTTNIPEMPAFGFKGWNTQADGKGTNYAAGDLYTSDESITLYAQWEALSRLVLPAGTTHIEEQAFEGIGAAIIEVPDGCLSIGMEAFRDCENLVQIYIPASVRSISFDAFDGCDKLTVFAPENSTAIKLAKALGINYEIVG